MNIWSKEHNAKKQSISTVKTIIKTTSMLDAKKAWQEKDDKRNMFFFFIKGENQPNTRANINLKFIQGKEKETGRIASYQLV